MVTHDVPPFLCENPVFLFVCLAVLIHYLCVVPAVNFICDNPDIKAISFVGSDQAVSTADISSYFSAPVFCKLVYDLGRLDCLVGPVVKVSRLGSIPAFQ